MRLVSLLCLVASNVFLLAAAAGGEEGGRHGHARVRGAAGGSSSPPRELLGKKKPKETEQLGSADPGGPASAASTTSSFETGCINADNRTYNLTKDEANNGVWMNEARKANGLQNLTYMADLVVEAQRWAKYSASKQAVRVRDHLNRNLFCGISRKLGENDLSSKSVNRTGAFAAMMNGGGRAYILYAPYDKYGIGIAKNGSWYYMVTLFRTLA